MSGAGVVVTFPAPGPLMSLNDRTHWAARARTTKAWRRTAARAAWRIRPPRHQPRSTVAVELPVRDRRRRDPHNYTPTLKAIVDGLVDAGLWPDDTPDHVHTLEPTLRVDRSYGGGDVVVRITPAPSETPHD